MKSFLQALDHQLQKISWQVIVGALLVVYVALGITNPGSDRHSLLNLEPYPDGLFYINTAHNIAQHGEYIVRYQDNTFKPYITPLYSYVLAVGFWFTTKPGIFYVVNLILGAITLTATLLTLRLITHKNWILALSGLVFLSHLLLVWLAMVPMAENATLALSAITLYFYFRLIKTGQWLDVILTVCGIASLVFTKYTMAGPAAVLALGALWYLGRHRAWTKLSLAISLLIVLAAVFLFTQNQQGFNPLFLLTTSYQLSSTYHETAGHEVFYSLRYVIPNAQQYVKALIGLGPQPSKLLWMPYALTSVGLVGIYLFCLTGLTYKRHSPALVLLLLFLSQFPILLIFYVVDQRYFVLTVPLLTIGMGYILQHLKPTRYVVVAVVAALAVQAVTQIPVARILIGNNWLQRSTAWQYESVKTFNAALPPNSYLITALPPLLIDAYSTKQYQVLPLSQRQEFIDKDQHIWGNHISYQDLHATYQQLLENGHEVFVTNAYLTSHAPLQTDFAAIQSKFDTRMVVEGCQKTCTIYQLQLKES